MLGGSGRVYVLDRVTMNACTPKGILVTRGMLSPLGVAMFLTPSQWMPSSLSLGMEA